MVFGFMDDVFGVPRIMQDDKFIVAGKIAVSWTNVIDRF